MEQRTHSPSSAVDEQIASLLGESGSTSIFDSLMGLPRAFGEGGLWDAAVARRLEARLARNLREALEDRAREAA